MTPEQEAVLGALLREHARDHGSQSEVVENVGKRAYNQARSRGGDKVNAKVAYRRAKEYARELMDMPGQEDRDMDQMAERRGL